jgi:transcriptional regulator with XRE-family HTH domain
MVGGNSSLRSVLAKNIRQLRNGRRISQEALADEAGLHRTFVGSIGRAERNVTISRSWHARSNAIQQRYLQAGARDETPRRQTVDGLK